MKVNVAVMYLSSLFYVKYAMKSSPNGPYMGGLRTCIMDHSPIRQTFEFGKSLAQLERAS